MGLRINTNVSALTALRTLSQNDRAQARSLERLATGLRINRASDDPSGLVISERLRNQLSALSQAVDNSVNSSNLISTADAALQEVADLLTEIQDSVVFALNTGGSSPDQIAAEQAAVDQAIAAIDRIAATTRFSDRNLLNGAQDFGLVGNRPAELQSLRVRSAFIPGGPDATKTFTVRMVEAPQRGVIRFSNVTQIVSGTTLRITGPRGTEEVAMQGTTTGANVAIRDAVNSVAGFTGVYAVAAGTDVYLLTEEFGVEQRIRVELTAGQIQGTSVDRLSGGETVGTPATTFATVITGNMNPGNIVNDDGRDGVVTFNGITFKGIGRSFSILTRIAQFEFDLNPASGTTASGTITTAVPLNTPISFTVGNRGMNFQLNELPLPTDRIQVGIEPVYASFLGIERVRDKIAEAIQGAASVSAPSSSASAIFRGGFLNSLRTGGGNDLFTNPGNASEIVRAAINQVSNLRGFLGAVQADAIEPNITALQVHIENLSSSLSQIRDLDFASETANFTRTQILFQSGIAVLASANLIPQSVLTLLG